MQAHPVAIRDYSAGTPHRSQVFLIVRGNHPGRAVASSHLLRFARGVYSPRDAISCLASLFLAAVLGKRYRAPSSIAGCVFTTLLRDAFRPTGGCASTVTMEVNFRMTDLVVDVTVTPSTAACFWLETSHLIALMLIIRNLVRIESTVPRLDDGTS